MNELNLDNIQIQITEKYEANQINVMLGLFLPGLKRNLERIIQNSKNEISNKYYQNEFNLRENKNKEELNKNIEMYNDELKRCNYSTLIEIEKDKFINIIEKYYNNKDITKLNIFYSLLLEDFFTLFINNNLSKSINKNIRHDIIQNENKEAQNQNVIKIQDQSDIGNLKKFLHLLVFLKFKNNIDINNRIQLLANSINWIESYEVEITILLKIFSKLNNLIPDLYNKVDNIIKLEQNKNEFSKRNREDKSKVNKAFFIGLESILKVITSNNQIYENLKNSQDAFTQLLNTNKDILQDAMQLDTNLNLYSIEIYSLQEILELIKVFNMNNIGTTDNIINIINYLKEEYIALNNGNKKDLCNNLEKYYTFISDKIQNYNEYDKVITKILYNKYLKVLDENYNVHILTIILKDNKFIINSKLIIKKIITNYISHNISDNITDNIKKLSNDKKPLIALLNSNNIPFLDEVILNIFEKEIIYYFESFKHMKNYEIIKKKFPKFYKDNNSLFNSNNPPNIFIGIIFDESLQIFKVCVEYLESIIINNNKIFNLAKLYAITYIKIYLRYLANFIKEKKSECKEIINFICSKNTNSRNVIKIYILKLLNSLIDNFGQFKNNDFEEYGLTFYKDFSSENEEINKCLNEHNNDSSVIKEENKKQLNNNNYCIKTIINELLPPSEDIYSPEIYPFFKYFILTKYSSKDEFIKKLGPPNIYKLKYPLLHQYLLENKHTKKLKDLPDFNEFTNYMVDYYSFKISRDDAKNKVLSSASVFKEQGFKNKFEKFISAWNEIKNDAIQYKRRDKMEPKELSENDKLIYFLNDDGEIGNGMYLAAACQNFITWQNNFLQPIIDSVGQNGILHYFLKNMKKKIPVQSAKKYQTLLLEDCFNNSMYYDFEDIISIYSRRDIFKEDGTINYLNYNSFIYDFESIEEELGRLLLPGKCLFDNEDNLNFVTYWSEGYRGGKSDTLFYFYFLYPQKDLDYEEKLKIINYIKNQKNNDFKLFLGSIQIIVFYLINNLNKGDDKIINIIKKAPKYLNNEDDCYKFFKNEGKEFKIEKLMNIYFYFEHACFIELCKTLQYRDEISKELQENIKNKLLNNNINEGIELKHLASAVRRYISRYLVGGRQSVVDENKYLLSFALNRNDLWENKVWKHNLGELINSKIGEFNLTVGQAYEFYKLIESEDEKFEQKKNNIN